VWTGGKKLPFELVLVLVVCRKSGKVTQLAWEVMREVVSGENVLLSLINLHPLMLSPTREIVLSAFGWWQLPHRAGHARGLVNICCVCVWQRWVVNMQIKQLRFIQHTPKHADKHTQIHVRVCSEQTQNLCWPLIRFTVSYCSVL